ncbi:MAG: hypothetical protein EXS10_02980 [Phycisphaerales bacterium]|nr:hypothetical protein [Phycisphaerales bacterium]
MTLPCNIDPNGTKLRIVAGALVEGIGLLLFVMWMMKMGPSWLIWPGAILWVGGTAIMMMGLLGCCPRRAVDAKTSC